MGCGDQLREDHHLRHAVNNIKAVLSSIKKLDMDYGSNLDNEDHINNVAEYVKRFMYTTHGFMPINICFSYLNHVLVSPNFPIDKKVRVAMLFTNFFHAANSHIAHNKGDCIKPRYYFAAALYEVKDEITSSKDLSDEFMYALLYVMSFDNQKVYLY